jgi:hypothetical protein
MCGLVFVLYNVPVSRKHTDVLPVRESENLGTNAESKQICRQTFGYLKSQGTK